MKINIAGTQLHYDEYGEKGSCVLLLHGWGCNAEMMKPLAERLMDQHKVLVPDFPGHGESGNPPEPWGVPEYAECIYELLCKLNAYPCTVIAHSFGCRVTALLETQHPELFSRIIFTGAAGIRKPENENASKRTQQYKQLKKVNSLIAKIPFLKGFSEDMAEVLVRRYGSPDYVALNSEMRKTFVKVINQDLSEYYPQFSHPTLLVWGKADSETPLWMGKKMEEWIPDAGLVELDGDHFVWLKQLQKFVIIVKAFIAED